MTVAVAYADDPERQRLVLMLRLWLILRRRLDLGRCDMGTHCRLDTRHAVHPRCCWCGNSL